MNRNFKIKDLVMCSLFSALISVCGIITVPSAVPFTLQTFAVMLSVYVLGLKNGIISLIIYILLGIVGMPVFSGMQAGFGAIAGPTGGFIIGFIPMCFVFGLLINKSKVLCCILSLSVLYLFGGVWYSAVTSSSLLAAFVISVVPFIIPDILKVLLAFFIGNRILKIIK